MFSVFSDIWGWCCQFWSASVLFLAFGNKIDTWSYKSTFIVEILAEVIPSRSLKFSDFLSLLFLKNNCLCNGFFGLCCFFLLKVRYCARTFWNLGLAGDLEVVWRTVFYLGHEQTSPPWAGRELLRRKRAETGLKSFPRRNGTQVRVISFSSQ